MFQLFPERSAEAWRMTLRRYRAGKEPPMRILPDESNRKSPKLKRAQNLKYAYGLSLEDFDTLAATQKGCCPICVKPTARLVVDHCHSSSDVRGLLCANHNAGLGFFNDNPAELARAIIYLVTRKKAEPPLEAPPVTLA